MARKLKQHPVPFRRAAVVGLNSASPLRRLLQLAKDNAGQGAGFRMAQNGDEATIYVYDVIGGWYGGVDAQSFAKELAGITAKTIHLRINSPGGDVFEARAMVTALREHKANVVAHVDGLAASAASYLMLAGSKVEIADGAFVMIHEAWGLVIGNKRDLRSTAELLDKIDASIAADYQRKAGDKTDWAAAMEAETWYTADEAKAVGLVDEVVGKDDKPKDATAKAWNLSAFDKTPAALLTALKPEPKAEPSFDRARAERRLQLIERTAA